MPKAKPKTVLEPPPLSDLQAMLLRTRATALRAQAKAMLDEADELDAIARLYAEPRPKPKRRYVPTPTHDRPLSAEHVRIGEEALRRMAARDRGRGARGGG
jgi:hypothetical protein